jgi:serine protease Do
MLSLLTSVTLVAVASTALPLDQLFQKVDGAVVTVRVAQHSVAESESAKVVAITTSLGSGVVLHGEGWVVTAAHVVEDAELIEVHFVDGQVSPASIVSLSRTEDVALLKTEVPPKRPVVAALGDSERLKPGMRLFAIGAPLGLEHTLTAGVVSALRRNTGPGLHPSRVLQTDAALNPGNSGGPIFNESGEVVGIASSIASRSGGSMGLNFAVPSATVRARLFEAALPWVGVSLRFIPKDVAELLNWPVESGLLVEKVARDGAAEKAGLRSGPVEAEIGGTEVRLGGDLIISVNEIATTDLAAIGKSLRALKVGDSIRYEVLRAGRRAVVEVPLPALPRIPLLPTLPAR